MFVNDLLIAESHLSSGVARDVHPAQEDPGVVRRAAPNHRRPPHFILHALVVLLVNYVVHTISVDQQILLFENFFNQKIQFDKYF